MPDESRPACGDLEPDELERAALAILIEEHPALLAVEELERDFGSDRDPVTARLMVADVIEHLHRDGLVHQVGPFVFATRAAIRASVLNS